MHCKSQFILADLWWAGPRDLRRRSSPGFLRCVETMQMVGSRRHVFAIALAARTPGERQTRNDIPHVLDAVLRPRRVASIRPKGNADAAQQTASVRVPERTQRAGNLVRRLVHRLRLVARPISPVAPKWRYGADANLTVSPNWAARLIRSRQKKAAWSGRYGVWRLFR